MNGIEKNDLINLNVTLAKIIRDHLISFKNMERMGILYSKSGKLHTESYNQKTHGDDTEWFLDELIWTFNTIALGGVEEIPESAELFQRMMDDYHEGNIKLNQFSKHKDYRKWLRSVKKNQTRVNKGLRLFSDNFESLWD